MNEWKPDKPLKIVISGPYAAGKSHLAQRIKDLLESDGIITIIDFPTKEVMKTLKKHKAKGVAVIQTVVDEDLFSEYMERR